MTLHLGASPLHRLTPSSAPLTPPILPSSAGTTDLFQTNNPMHHFRKIASLALVFLLTSALGSCKHDHTPTPGVDPPGIETPTEPPLETPFTPIPDELVGTWFADHNEGPLTIDWQKGTFQGEQGFREFRTMVFAKDGRNAVEYTTEVANVGNETRQIFYKITGTLVYQDNPASLTFYAQSGIRRVFSSAYSGYRDAPILASDMQRYRIVWEKPQATNMSSAKNFLTATITDRNGRYSVKYEKVGSASQRPTTGLPSTTPITTGTSVKIGVLYYPTVLIGNQEWLATNYAGPGSLKENSKPEYGTFLEYADLKNVPLPTGWRIPTRQDYVTLLESQGITVYDWGTDGDDVTSKRLLGQLMATDAWTKKDGYANNLSGFNAIPADVRRPNGTNYGEGSNCTLWTSGRDSQDSPLVFNIIQLPGSTYARFTPQALSTFPTLTPLRLVKTR
ncbi:FISUMP domain-containing protein [Fibrella forsythiae]|uniref:Fibrobacter succinogenes major paralogous domain-containing protein n=1 Tax=Fibrella forsythiae TaxID=2817061 RepID=A0ABS3JS75_9BACT|nr:FISUMP domain-containing protein [Fibrella forsythiae]MBO0952875.1 hypothetical protein [Fibrella forsythiae]